jgi:hypothetical protein
LATPLGDARSRADGDHLAHHALRHAHLCQVQHGVQIKPGTGAKAVGLQPALGLERGDVPGVEGAIVPLVGGGDGNGLPGAAIDLGIVRREVQHAGVADAAVGGDAIADLEVFDVDLVAIAFEDVG